jgi:hypothetical protein
MDQNDPAYQMKLYLRVLARRAHLAVADVLFSIMKPAIFESQGWMGPTLDDLEDGLNIANDNIRHLENGLDELRVQVDRLED